VDEPLARNSSQAHSSPREMTVTRVCSAQCPKTGRNDPPLERFFPVSHCLIPTIGATFLCFAPKIVAHSRHLPTGQLNTITLVALARRTCSSKLASGRAFEISLVRDSLRAIPAQMPCRSVASSGRGWLEAILWCHLPDGSRRGEDRGEGRNTPSIVEQNECDV